MVSGTTGLAGAADTICVMKREVGLADATFYLRGRDVPEADHAMNFDPVTCTWTLLGEASEYTRSAERQAIIDVLQEMGEAMSPKRLAEALGKKDGAVRFLLHKMVQDGDVVSAGGAYSLPTMTTNTANAPIKRRMALGDVSERTPNTPTNTTNTHATVSGVSGVSGVSTNRGVSGKERNLFDRDEDVQHLCVCGEPIPPGRKWSCRDDCEGRP